MIDEPWTPDEEYELHASFCHGGPHAAEVARIKELAFNDEVLYRIREKSEISLDDRREEALREFAEHVAEFRAARIGGDDPAAADKIRDAFGLRNRKARFEKIMEGYLQTFRQHRE